MTYRLVSTLTGRELGRGSLPDVRLALRSLVALPSRLYLPGTLDIHPIPERTA